MHNTLNPFHSTLLTGSPLACVSANAARAVRCVASATAGDTELKLDRHLPDRSARVGLIVWVHDGATFIADANLARIDAFLRSHLPRN